MFVMIGFSATILEVLEPQSSLLSKWAKFLYVVPMKECRI